MKISGTPDVGMIDERAIFCRFWPAVFQPVLKDGNDGRVGMGADLKSPFASRLEALRAMAFG